MTGWSAQTPAWCICPEDMIQLTDQRLGCYLNLLSITEHFMRHSLMAAELQSHPGTGYEKLEQPSYRGYVLKSAACCLT